MSAIAYPVGNSLYLNITNRCLNECTFCIRNKSPLFNQKHQLWLEKEPTVEEIIQTIGDPTKYEQIVFCGYGEPLIRLDEVIAVCQQLKSQFPGTRIRIDTNGEANLFWQKNILPELLGLVDLISISLNAESAEKYQKLCHSFYGEKGYPGVIDFIKSAVKVVPQVEVTTVDLPGIDQEKCRTIATSLGATFRIRPYYEETYIR